MKNQNVVTTDKFYLSQNPDAYVVSLHIRNLMATYGEEKTLSLIKELFLTSSVSKKTSKKSAKLG